MDYEFVDFPRADAFYCLDFCGLLSANTYVKSAANCIKGCVVEALGLSN